MHPTIAQSVKLINRNFANAWDTGDKETATAYFILANFVNNYIAKGIPVHG